MAKKPTKTESKQRSGARAGGAEPGPVAVQNVILERIEEQQRVVIEAVTMTRDALRREMGEMKQELSSKIGVLEIAVRSNSAAIHTLAEKLDTKADANRVSALEQRVEVLETSVG